MRGSLIITFDDVDGFGGDYLDVYVNSVLNKRIYYNSNSLYSCPLYVNDVVNIQFSDSTNTLNYNVNRIDYTTDDEGGDNGIKNTFIKNSFSTGVTFTATTLNTSYDFEYKIDYSTGYTCFNVGTGFQTDTTNSNVELFDGTLVIVGQFTNYNGTSLNRIVGLNQNGTINSNFNYGTGLNGDGASGEKLQSDGKIIVAGRFWEYRGNTSSKIVRINTDGSWDNTFNVGTGFTSGGTYTSAVIDVSAIDIQSDGKIVCGGTFDAYKGVSVPGLCRLNSDATLDTSFSGFTTGFDSNINDIIIQTDGKIIIVGQFTTFNGITRNRIVRLNSDGSYDTTFSGVTTGFNSQVYECQLQTDGKIIVVGDFTQFNGSGINTTRIVRLNTNGSRDTSFVIGNGFNSSVRSVAIENDGGIICGGLFTSFSGVTANRIIGLNSNGSINTSFVYGTGMGTAGGLEVTDIDVLSDNTILVMGEFFEYNGVAANRIIRLSPTGTLLNCP